MKIELLGRIAELTRAVLMHVTRRLTFALCRFGERIGLVTVRLSNIRGTRGAVDKRCQVHVRLRPSGDVKVEDTNASGGLAVDHAAHRASRAVGRKLELERVAGRAPDHRKARGRPKL